MLKGVAEAAVDEENVEVLRPLLGVLGWEGMTSLEVRLLDEVAMILHQMSEMVSVRVNTIQVKGYMYN